MRCTLANIVVDVPIVEVTNGSYVEAVNGTVNTELTKASDVEVIGSKQEYSIVGDALYASVTAGDAPSWLTNIIDSTVAFGLSSGLQDLLAANTSLLSALSEVEIAKNQYQQLINIDLTVDASVVSHLSTINATLGQNSASILSLDASKVTATEASALALTQITAELGTSGGIGSQVTRIDSAIASLDQAYAMSIDTLTATYESVNTDLSGVASATNVLNSYVGLDPNGNPDGTGLLASSSDITQLEIDLAYETTNRISADSVVENSLTAYVDSNILDVESKWSYNSVIRAGGDYYITGFGLTANNATGAGTEVDPFTSEFWVNAEKFKFTNTNNTGGISPFTIDASGAYPEISFNGKVSFGNITGGTPALADMSNVVTIDGGKITANTLTVTNSEISGSLTSNNYVLGSTGWRIDKTGGGYAEFNNVVVRGYLQAGGVSKVAGISAGGGLVLTTAWQTLISYGGAIFFSPLAQIIIVNIGIVAQHGSPINSLLGRIVVNGAVVANLTNVGGNRTTITMVGVRYLPANTLLDVSIQVRKSDLTVDPTSIEFANGSVVGVTA